MKPARPFWSLVDKSGDCWIWLGGRNKFGYGEIGSRKGNRPTVSQTKLAHRISYELLVGAIPDGMHLDHLCRRPECVNPTHLEPVTVKENVRRGLNGELGLYCPSGHRYEPGSYTVRSSDGARRCRACGRDAIARRREDQRLRGIAAASVTAQCSVCDRAYGVRLDGCIFTHTISGVRFSERCPGSGNLPRATVRAELKTLNYGGDQ